MIKGCRRNVVWVKNTGSEMFEEAFFILSDKCDKKKAAETDMLTAAHSIIESGRALPVTKGAERAEEAKGKSIAELIWFSLGALVMAGLNAILYLIL